MVAGSVDARSTWRSRHPRTDGKHEQKASSSPRMCSTGPRPSPCMVTTSAPLGGRNGHLRKNARGREHFSWAGHGPAPLHNMPAANAHKPVPPPPQPPPTDGELELSVPQEGLQRTAAPTGTTPGLHTGSPPGRHAAATTLPTPQPPPADGELALSIPQEGPQRTAAPRAPHRVSTQGHQQAATRPRLHCQPRSLLPIPNPEA